MSGHNKWSQIKHKKEKTDGAKAKVFSKYSKLITSEARLAKGDRNSPGLRAAIERARVEDVTNDVIDRAVKKATEAGGATLETILYEAYGPGGCAMMIEALTDNRNKAAQEVKHILSTNGFALAAMGSASWAFEKKDNKWFPTMTVELSDADINLLDKLVGELEESDEVQEVFTNAE
jgi:YebC/PmpR family DNA-binding regulatory protein